MNIRKVFDSLLELKEGESLKLSFPSLEALHSTRIALYREGKRFREATGGEEALSIQVNLLAKTMLVKNKIFTDSEFLVEKVFEDGSTVELKL